MKLFLSFNLPHKIIVHKQAHSMFALISLNIQIIFILALSQRQYRDKFSHKATDTTVELRICSDHLEKYF